MNDVAGNMTKTVTNSNVTNSDVGNVAIGSDVSKGNTTKQEAKIGELGCFWGAPFGLIGSGRRSWCWRHGFPVNDATALKATRDGMFSFWLMEADCLCYRRLPVSLCDMFDAVNDMYCFVRLTLTMI